MKMKNTKLKLALLVMIAVGVFMAFAGEKSSQSTYVSVSFDRTGKMTAQNVEVIVRYIIHHTKIDTAQGKWGDITVDLSMIGQTSAPKVNTIKLAKSEPYWSRNEMESKKRLREFLEKLEDVVRSLTLPSSGMLKSYVNRNTFYQLHSLAGKSGRKVYLIWSNLIEHSSRVNHYNYRAAPEVIIEHQDSLYQIMAKDYPLPRLNGIKIFNIHSSNQTDDELHEFCKRYWKKYWEDNGANVTFLTNVPNA